jgi:hypothetical protein
MSCNSFYDQGLDKWAAYQRVNYHREQDYDPDEDNEVLNRFFNTFEHLMLKKSINKIT